MPSVRSCSKARVWTHVSSTPRTYRKVPKLVQTVEDNFNRHKASHVSWKTAKMMISTEQKKAPGISNDEGYLMSCCWA